MFASWQPPVGLLVLTLRAATRSWPARHHVEIVEGVRSYLRDTLAVLSAVEDGPGDTAGVLSLQEEGLRLAVLESENLAVATDVELTLQSKTISLRHVHDVDPMPSP